jgi:hypothetical protein
MNVWDIVPATAAVGWTAIVANLVVIPFYSVRERWHKDYVDSGTLAQAKAYIDTNKLIPALADIVDLVVGEKKSKSKVPTATLLETVDYLPCLERAESATREKSELDEHMTKLEVTAKKLWRWGLAHICATVAAWAVVAFTYADHGSIGAESRTRQPQSTTFWVSIVIVGLAVTISALCILWHFWTYDRCRDSFFASLRTNRQ